MVQLAILANVEAQAEELQVQDLHEHLTPALAAEQTLTLNKNVKRELEAYLHGRLGQYPGSASRDRKTDKFLLMLSLCLV